MTAAPASISVAVPVEILGFILNKLRDCATNKLKYGDLTNEELCQVLIRDLKEINTKLDSLKDLDASDSFLKKIISFLIDKPSEDQETRDSQDKAAGIDSPSGGLYAALTCPQEIQKLQISTEKRFEEAKKSCQKARRSATRAFSDQSLSIRDRIMACKIRVAARIFESGLEEPEVAVFACLLVLNELHSLPAIQDMFEVHRKGGIISWLNKTERLENIMSVLFINHALFEFAAKCSSKYPNVFTWPGIELADRTINPILHAFDIVKKTSSSEEFGQPLNRMLVNKEIPGRDLCFSAVNSRSEIIFLHDNQIGVLSICNKKNVAMSDESESSVVKRKRKAVAVDSDDNVYIVNYLAIRSEDGDKENFELCILDGKYRTKHNPKLLGFVKAGEYANVGIAVDKNKNIIMIRSGDNEVYVCDSTGVFKRKFKRDGDYQWYLGISDQNDILIPSGNYSGVHVYTTEGKLKSTLEVPEGHVVCQAAFHHGLDDIIVLTYVPMLESQTLFCYSKTGVLKHSVHNLPTHCYIASHPSGNFAILQDERIIFV